MGSYLTLGKVFAQYWVMCGKCGTQQVLDAFKYEDTYAKATELNWRKTTRKGWLCPDCLKNYKRPG